MRHLLLALLLSATALPACAGRRPVDGDDQSPGGARPRGATGAPDVVGLYRRVGLLAESEPIPFVGRVAYFAGPAPESTFVLVALSMPSSAFTFVRDADRFRASYQVRVELRQGNAPARRVEAHELVRVASFRETQRGDESILFQQALSAPPGAYTLSVAVRDEGSAKSGSHETSVQVPALAGNSFSTPLPVYEATARLNRDSVPRVVVSPRGAVTFGRDTSVAIYLEGYGVSASAADARLPVRLTVRGERGATVWSDTASLPRRGDLFAGVVPVPVSRLGIGPTALSVAPVQGGDGGPGAPLLVTFGDDLPVADLDDILNYLRYFTNPGRLQAIRDASPEDRPAAWSAFLAETDPVPSTPAHEGLREYFRRVAIANQRFRDEGARGWMSDRGMVYVTLGEPDNIYESGSAEIAQRNRAQQWEYRQYSAVLTFIDQSGFGRWRLTPRSENEFRGLAARVRR